MKRETFLSRIRDSKTVKSFMALTGLSLLTQLVAPTASYALTSGAAQPEFTSFEPVATTDMVNDFTGDFTYNAPVLNIPGPDGGGYSMSLSYHAGATQEEEASWVGFGWTLNAGAINRQKRGFADDFKDVNVIKYNKVKPNWTHSAAFDVGVEIKSSDASEESGSSDSEDSEESEGNKIKALKKFTEKLKNIEFGDINVSFNNTVRYNNYSGFSISKRFGVGASGLGSLSLNRSAAESTLGFSINPILILNGVEKFANKTKRKQKKLWKAVAKIAKAVKKAINKVNQINKDFGHGPVMYSGWSFNAPAVPYSVAYNAGNAFNMSYSFNLNPVPTVGIQFGIKGNSNYQVGYPEVTSRAYGYMYNPNLSQYEENEGRVYDTDGDGIPEGDVDVATPSEVQMWEADEDFIIEADYQIEKATTFNRHDRNLGIPFNNADMFMATGNGVVGSFKMLHNKIGHYYPTFVTNHQEISQMGFEAGAWAPIQIGFDVGTGSQTTTVHDWKKVKKAIDDDDEIINDIEFDNTVLPFMRFAGDMGGDVNYSWDRFGTTNAYVSGIGKKLNLEDFVGAADRPKNVLYTEVEGRTSYIEYAHYNEIGVLQAKLDKTSIVLTDLEKANTVAQIKVTDKNGGISTYGQPVYTKNETELTIGLEHNPVVDKRKIVKGELDFDNPLQNRTVIGQKIASPYASTYLLTQKVTSDYIDVDDNGPSAKDFGGWTLFDYKKVHGNSANDWYRYRAPYQGLFYNKGRFFDNQDESGSMSSGEKEVFYLKSIETKTHIAFFVTNSVIGVNEFQGKLDDINDGAQTKLTPTELINLVNSLDGSGDTRRDGLDATAIDGNGKDPAANSYHATGDHDLEKLERIVLFAKSDLSKSVSTTYFDYDYSVCKDVPNSSSSSGKLTLKKVWTESGGIHRGKMAPYQFKYEYKKEAEYAQSVKDKYPGITSEYNHLSTAEQNPDYRNGRLDTWGNYAVDGRKRNENMQAWVDQSAEGQVNFDPAAWQLKQIILPSGGEIHIQYEQKDYMYVQDERAMAMVSLFDHPNTKHEYKSDENEYYINLDDIQVSIGEIDSYVTLLREYFVDGGEKIYFKFLNALHGGGAPTFDYSFMKADYISGYTTVNTVERVPGTNDVRLMLGEVKRKKKDGTIKRDKKDKTLPRWVAYRQYLTAADISLGQWNNGLMLHDVKGDDITILDEAFNDATGQLDEDNLKTEFKKLGRKNTFNLFKDWLNGRIKNKKKKDVCGEINKSFSYFRLPVYHPKKGGGIRVKRLLSYDPGISADDGDAMLFGSEYHYIDLETNISSGVATNEPPSTREENALVKILDRNKQSGWHRVFNGKDTKQFEGPIGEQLLPGAAVAHSRVVIKGIHSGKTNTGFAVNTYHTVKGDPTIANYKDKDEELEEKNRDPFSRQTELTKKGSKPTYKKLNLSIPLGLINIEIHKAWLTQGYLFQISDMHGKPNEISTYAAAYSRADLIKDDPIQPTASTTYNYSNLGERITSLVYNSINKEFTIQKLMPGTEEDLTLYRSRVTDKVNDLSVEIDLNIVIPYVYPTFGITYNYTVNELSQHVTSKVVRLKSYLKSTTSTVDGVTQTTDILAYDKNTGDPVLSRTYDGFTSDTERMYGQFDGQNKHAGYYYALNFPASWMYDDMGMKSKNTTRTNQLTASVGNIVTHGGNELHQAILTHDGYGDDISTFAQYISPENWSAQFSNVVSASSVVLRHNWFASSNPNYDEIKNNHMKNDTDSYVDLNQTKLNKHRYPYRSYMYRTDIKSANDAATLIYGGGVTQGAFDLFVWRDTDVLNRYTSIPKFDGTTENDKWFSPSEVVSYSPNGFPLEEKNVLDIYSTAHFGYNNTLPTIVAQNAGYDEIKFIDFEHGIPDAEVQYLNSSAHSGRFSFNLKLKPSKEFATYTINNDLLNRGISIKFWLKSSLHTDSQNSKYGRKNLTPQLKVKLNAQEYDCKRIAQTGEWSLYEAVVKQSQLGDVAITLQYSFDSSNEEVLIDDFKIHPFDAVTNCTVYTKENRVAAQFDDQHFGVFYEYNKEGQLVRKSIETERGRKTIQEQQYNVPLIQN